MAQSKRNLAVRLHSLLHPQLGSKRYIDVIFFIVPLPWVIPLITLGLMKLGILHLQQSYANASPDDYQYAGPGFVDGSITGPLAVVLLILVTAFLLSLASMFLIALIRITYRFRNRV
jgi:hypothetical protein